MEIVSSVDLNKFQENRQIAYFLMKGSFRPFEAGSSEPGYFHHLGLVFTSTLHEIKQNYLKLGEKALSACKAQTTIPALEQHTHRFRKIIAAY